MDTIYSIQKIVILIFSEKHPITGSMHWVEYGFYCSE